MEDNRSFGICLSQMGIMLFCYLLFSWPVLLRCLSAVVPGMCSFIFLRARLYLLLSAGLSGIACLRQGRSREEMRRYLPLLPLAELSIFCLLRCADTLGPVEYGLIAVVLALMVILTWRIRERGHHRFIRFVSFALLGILQFFFFGSLLLVDITTLDLPCPTEQDYGRYEAHVRISDQGALGGSTEITISRKRVDLAFGELRMVEAQRDMDWIDPDRLRIAWSDDGEILFINREPWRWR